MPLKEEVLDQFLGDEAFPVEWSSDTEKLLFWVYDDLHCPHPLSPMYEDIGGWWLSCDHMFRRFGTPFATDWIYKNINGYLYTAAIPAEAGLEVITQEYDLATRPIVPQAHDGAYAGKKPSDVATSPGRHVPGAPALSNTLFDISQVLAWLARDRSKNQA